MSAAVPVIMTIRLAAGVHGGGGIASSGAAAHGGERGIACGGGAAPGPKMQLYMQNAPTSDGHIVLIGIQVVHCIYLPSHSQADAKLDAWQQEMTSSAGARTEAEQDLLEDYTLAACACNDDRVHLERGVLCAEGLILTAGTERQVG